MSDQDEPRPARPRVVDRTARAEHEWVDGEAQRRNDRWEKRKRSIDSDRRSRRAELGTLELHRSAIERQATLSSVAAGNVEPSRGGSERVGPPAQQVLEDDPRWREHWTVIRSRLERAHELLDEAEGLGPVAAKTMLSSEKNRMILLEGRGHPCDVVVDLLGRDVAGSQRTVWRVRHNTQNPESEEFRLLGFAVSTVDGEPLAERPSDRERPRGRRVRID